MLDKVNVPLFNGFFANYTELWESEFDCEGVLSLVQLLLELLVVFLFLSDVNTSHPSLNVLEGIALIIDDLNLESQIALTVKHHDEVSFVFYRADTNCLFNIRSFGHP